MISAATSATEEAVSPEAALGIAPSARAEQVPSGSAIAPPAVPSSEWRFPASNFGEPEGFFHEPLPCGWPTLVGQHRPTYGARLCRKGQTREECSKVCYDRGPWPSEVVEQAFLFNLPHLVALILAIPWFVRAHRRATRRREREAEELRDG